MSFRHLIPTGLTTSSGPAASTGPAANVRTVRSLPVAMIAAAVLATVGSGCTPIRAVPVNHLPNRAKARSKDTLVELSLSRLRQTPAPVYLLDSGDILGVHIPVILGAADEPPVVHFPDEGNMDPALGYPIPVREDGTLALPLLETPVNVRGLSLIDATERIREAYIATKLLPPKKENVIVTLMRKRTVNVLVVREEGDTAKTRDEDEESQGGDGFSLELPIGENDLLHALTETGGLPGLDAKNEILIYKAGFAGSAERDALVASLNNGVGPNGCRIPLPDDPNVIKIPIRFFPNELPRFTEQDIILGEGDIVMVQSRNREKFYTSGLLGGGEFRIPRDYDIDVLQAIAIAGGSYGGSSGVSAIGARGGNPYGGAGGGSLPPSRAVVLRKLPDCGIEIPIEVNLKHALTDPSQRLIIQPEDTIVIRYTFCEEVANVALNLFQVNYFLNGRN